MQGPDNIKRRRHDNYATSEQPAEIDALENKALRARFVRLYSTEIDWNAAAERLRGGDLSALPYMSLLVLLKMADDRDVSDLADAIGIPPSLLLIGLLAHRAAAQDRAASRLFRALVPKAFRAEAEALAGRLAETALRSNCSLED